MAINTTDVLAAMDEEVQKAQESGASRHVPPTFLRLKDKQKARIRPLFNLDKAVMLDMHSKYSKAENKYLVNAVCSASIGEECPHCKAATDDKELKATLAFMLPVFVASVEEKDSKGDWHPLKNKEGAPIKFDSMRILELKAFGTINQVLQFLRTLHHEDDNNDIRGYGLIIERIGGDRKTTYSVMPKPSPMPDAAKDVVPDAEDVKMRVLAACPPAGDTSDNFLVED